MTGATEDSPWLSLLPGGYRLEPVNTFGGDTRGRLAIRITRDCWPATAPAVYIYGDRPIDTYDRAEAWCNLDRLRNP
jgi:hypothetical protein